MMVSSTPDLPPCCTKIVEQRNQRIAALQREAFLTHILGVQVALERLRGGQLPQNIFLLIHAEATAHALGLEGVLKPQALVAVRHMGELRADGIAVDELQLAQDIFELDALRNRFVAAVREELGLKVGIGQTEILDIEHIGPGAFLQAQRIEIGDQVAAIGIDLNEARHRALFGAGKVNLGNRGRSRRRRNRRAGLQVGQALAEWPCAQLQWSSLPFKPAKVPRPGWIDRRGIPSKTVRRDPR